MADDIYQILGSVIDLWELPTRGDNEYVDTTEFWLDRKKNTVKVSSRKIAPDERSAWFDERTQGEGDKTKSLLARFVWVEANAPEHHISLALSVQQHVVQKFGLTLAHHYFKSNLSGVNAFPRVAKSHADRRSYAFCFGPKRAAIWSQTVPKDATSEPFIEGIFFLQAMPRGRTWTDGMPGGSAAQFQKLIERAPWAPEVVRSSAFPAYLNALVFSKEITQTVAERSAQIRSIESRTGFHEYQGRGEPFEPDEILHEVSARASGISTKLASVTRKAQMTEKLLDFVDQMVEEDHYHFESQRPDSQPPRGPGKHLLTKNVSVLKQRLEMQAAETAYALKRVQTQSTVLFNLISLAEAEQNTALSHSMKRIALTTQRDAASMKTLAYVTMFFLPGSFVSALFSTPLFQWDDVDLTSSSIKIGTTPQFKLYWAVTVPLTIITFICYFLWLWWQHQQRKNLNKKRSSTEPTLAERMAELEGATIKRMAERDIIRKRKNTVQSEDYSIPMTGVSSWRSTWRNTWGKDQHV